MKALRARARAFAAPLALLIAAILTLDCQAKITASVTDETVLVSIEPISEAIDTTFVGRTLLTVQMIAHDKEANGLNVPIIWKSSNTAVLRVDPSDQQKSTTAGNGDFGVIFDAMSEGDAVLTATTNTAAKTITGAPLVFSYSVHVSGPPVSLKISPAGPVVITVYDNLQSSSAIATATVVLRSASGQLVRTTHQQGSTDRGNMKDSISIKWSLLDGPNVDFAGNPVPVLLGSSRALIFTGRQQGINRLVASLAAGSNYPAMADTIAVIVGGGSVTVETAPTTGVFSLLVGDTQRFTALVKDVAGAVVQSPNVQWSTSAANIATIDQTGKLTAVSAGANGDTVSVLAFVPGLGITGRYVITVRRRVSRIVIDPNPISLAEDDAVRLNAHFFDAAGNPVVGVDGTKQTWAISGGGTIADFITFDVDVNDDSTRFLRGRLAGDATLTVSYPGATTASVPLHVFASSFALTMQSPSIGVTSVSPATNVVTLSRVSFPGPIALTATSAMGINLVFSPQTTLLNQSTLTVSVQNGVPLAAGTYPVTVTASVATSAKTASSTFNVVVSSAPPPGSFTLRAATDALPVPSNGSVQDIVVNITRNNFPGAILITGSGDGGITFTANPSSVTGNSTTLTVRVPGSAATGPHHVTVTGTSGAVVASTDIFVEKVSGGLSAVRIEMTAAPVVASILPGQQLAYTARALDINGLIAFDCPVEFAIDKSVVANRTATTILAQVSRTTVTGLGAGTTPMRAFCDDARPLFTAARLTVADATFGVTQVNVSPRFTYMPSSALVTTTQFNAAVVQNSGGALSPVVWTIDQPAGGLLTIDQTGKVSVPVSTGVNFGGGARITATASGQTDISWVTYGNAGSIRGNMVSTSGMFLGGMSVLATPDAGGASTVATVNNEGIFYLSGLKVGTYFVTVSQQSNPAQQLFGGVVVTAGGTTLLTLAPFP